MPFGGARDILITLRARDLASRVFYDIGSAMKGMGNMGDMTSRQMLSAGAGLAAVGLGVGAVGVAGIKFLSSATDEAIEFDQQIRLAATQTDGMGENIKALHDLVLRVGRDIPVPFEDLNKTLYDIFSSIDVSVPQAEKLLRELGKAGVAGQVPLQDASRATLAILNAFHLPVEQVNRVLDVQFGMVRTGVGTYEQFQGAIGRVIPAAVRAGQSFEDTAGAMAFLTRNGLSTEMAATSLARGLESMINPKAREKLSELGVEVADANGKFRPFVQVIGDLGQKLNGMPPAEKIDVLNNIFKGAGGTIQARRFWDLSLNSFDQFKGIVDEMSGPSVTGAMEQAFGLMGDSAQTQSQKMENALKAARIEIGDHLIPVKLKLAETILRLVDAWDRLSPATQKNIVIAAAITSVIFVLLGAILLIAGAMLILAGVAGVLGIGLLPLVLIIGGIIAAMIAIGVAVYFVVKHWDTIKEKTREAWTAVVNWIKGAWESIKTWFRDGIQWVKDTWNAGWATIYDFFYNLWNGILDTVQSVWQSVVNFFTVTVPQTFRDFVQTVKDIWNAIPQFFYDLFYVHIPFLIGYAIGTIVEFVVKGFHSVVDTAIAIWNGLWKFFTEILPRIYASVIDWIAKLIEDAIHWFAALPGRVADWMSRTWDSITSWAARMWDSFTGWISRTIEEVSNWFAELPGRIGRFLEDTWNRLVGMAGRFFTGAKDTGKSLLDGFLEWVKGLPGAVMDLFEQMLRDVVNVGGRLWQAAKDAASNFVRGFTKGLDPGSPFLPERQVLGIVDTWQQSLSSMKRMVPEFTNIASGIPGFGSDGVAVATNVAGANVNNQPISVGIGEGAFVVNIYGDADREMIREEFEQFKFDIARAIVAGKRV